MFRWFLLPIFAAALPSAASAQAPEEEPLILAFGDSLTAGYGLGRGLVSGDTTSGGRARLGWTLDGMSRKPNLVIVELGANDMLRGVEPSVAGGNLDAMLAELRRRNIPVLLAGMLAAPNLDPGYRRCFETIYPKLAREHDATLYPFFLQGVAGNRALLLADGIHPNFEGVKRIVTGILPTVQRALGRSR
jgi:acyl-CoA thioesterase-1